MQLEITGGVLTRFESIGYLVDEVDEDIETAGIISRVDRFVIQVRQEVKRP